MLLPEPYYTSTRTIGCFYPNHPPLAPLPSALSTFTIVPERPSCTMRRLLSQRLNGWLICSRILAESLVRLQSPFFGTLRHRVTEGLQSHFTHRRLRRKEFFEATRGIHFLLGSAWVCISALSFGARAICAICERKRGCIGLSYRQKNLSHVGEG